MFFYTGLLESSLRAPSRQGDGLLRPGVKRVGNTIGREATEVFLVGWLGQSRGENLGALGLW